VPRVDIDHPSSDEINGPHECKNFKKAKIAITHSGTRKLYFKGPKRMLKMIRWRVPSWSEVLGGEPSCPYPPELIPFFERIRVRFGKQEFPRWPVGYAPCGPFQESGKIDCQVNGQTITIEEFSNYTRYREADIVLTHYPYPFALPGHEWNPPFFDRDMMPTRLAYQKWVSCFYGEPVSMFPITSFLSYMLQYDLQIGEPRDLVDIYVPGQVFSLDFHKFQDVEPQPRVKRTDANIVWICSNCMNTNNGRIEYVQELMKHIPVHSYGSCLHNIDSPLNNNSESH
jgi:hypothetical protein